MSRTHPSSTRPGVRSSWPLHDAVMRRKAKKSKRAKNPGDLPWQPYQPPAWDPDITRPGAMAHLQCPSRIGDRLIYRDGRIDHLGGQK